MFHSMQVRFAFKKQQAPAAAPSTRSTAVHMTELLESNGSSAQMAGQMRSLAKETFAKMRPKVKRANKYLAAARKRLDKGKLGKDNPGRIAHMAETAPVNMAVSLHGALTRMYDVAKKRDDVGPLARVTMAAAILSGHLDSRSLLHEGNYPEGDEVIFNGLVSQRLSDAMALHKKISAELRDAPEVLGITLIKPQK